jgi:hypothetical protein
MAACSAGGGTFLSGQFGHRQPHSPSPVVLVRFCYLLLSYGALGRKKEILILFFERSQWLLPLLLRGTHGRDRTLVAGCSYMNELSAGSIVQVDPQYHLIFPG